MSISSEAVAAAIRTRFIREVEEPEGVTVYYANLPAASSPSGTHIVVHILDAETVPISLGAARFDGCYRKTGILQADVYIPIEQGTSEARRLADVVAEAFRGVSSMGVEYFTPSDRPFGVEGEFYRHEVEVPWKAEG